MHLNLRYVNTGVVFQEIPDEVTLSINISGCPCHCIGCHSQYLWEDIGEPLDVKALEDMMQKYASDITCVCFMGGDAHPGEVNFLAQWLRTEYPNLLVGWYSGRNTIAKCIELENFDFVKLGPYVENKGPLNKSTTNQRFYKVGKDKSMTDITSKFWKK